MKKFLVEVRKDSRVSEYLLSMAVIKLITEQDDVDIFNVEYEVVEVNNDGKKIVFGRKEGHYMGEKAPINECSHCGSNKGYYTKEQVYGTVRYRRNFDGSEADNNELYDYLTHKGGKLAYCFECNKKLFNMRG